MSRPSDPRSIEVTAPAYTLVSLPNGAFSVRSNFDGETFHPVAGPTAEAETLYVRQLRLREHVAQTGHTTQFVIWDVGLGAGGNVFTALRSLSDVPAHLHIVSFDRTLEALRFAREQARLLEFPHGFEDVMAQLLDTRLATFQHGSLDVLWEIQLGDLPARLAAAATKNDLPPPHAVFFDAFSPARNPEMWTLGLFENLFRCLDPERPCSLATFSRSTMTRTALLLAGFFVGAGVPVAGKEETTTAANKLELIGTPLERSWLERARVSRSAEPLRSSAYQRTALTANTWERLRQHPQFS